METSRERVYFIDYLRVIACFMVMLVHSCEPFYLGGTGTYIASMEDGMWVTIIDSAMRSSVPLFVMASSYLLFPLQTDTLSFFKRRFLRVVIPFVLWMIAYALIPLYSEDYHLYKWGDIFNNLVQLPLNFVGVAGHLWFVFMLLGVYLVMPIFSPWINKVSRRGEECFLALWFFTTFLPFIHLFATLHTGQGYIWGEALWNQYGLLYGVSGFMGYVVLGHYLRTYWSGLSLKHSLLVSIPLLLVGYAIVAFGFWHAMPKEFPHESNIYTAVRMEMTWEFCTTGVALMTVGYFLLIRHLNFKGAMYKYFILPISSASYGMYLMHIFFLCFHIVWIKALTGNTFLTIICTAIATYVSSFVLSYLMRRIPVIGKYLVG